MKMVFLLAPIVLLAACAKDKEAADTELPVITMSSPANNQFFSAGQSVNITGTVTDNIKIKQVHLEIINAATGSFISHEHFVPAAASYNLSKTFTALASTNYILKIIAEDGAGNLAKTEINISSN